MRRQVLCGACALAAVILAIPAAPASERMLIAVPGAATKTVATDELHITCDLSTEGSSFAGAMEEAAKLVERIRVELGADYAGRVLVDSQVIVLRQKRVSWSSKAKKLNHIVTITIGGFQQDLPGQAVKVLDKLLALDSRLEVADMAGQLSNDKFARIRAELLQVALQDARARAETLAKEAGQRVVSATIINAAPRYSVSTYGNRVEHLVVSSGSFSISADLMGQVEMTVELVAEYATARV